MEPAGPTGVGDDLATLLDLAVDVAEEASSSLLDAFGGPPPVTATKSSPTDMVTDIDRRTERLIVDRLLAARPDDAVLGEELGARQGRSGVRWVIDPLDGTTNFLYGYPGFGVSIGAEIEGVPAVGVVVDTVRAEVFAAAAGLGASCNGRAVTVAGDTHLPQALVGTGFSYDPDRRERQAGVLTVVLPRVRDIRRGGAAAVDLCSVACGRLDGFYERGLAPWDLAAGCLIAAEAGATVGDLDGDGASPAFCLAATPRIFEPLRALLDRANARTA